MSQVLKGNILGVGTLENRIFEAINFFGCANGYTFDADPCVAQRKFAERLAEAISEGVSKGVQEYLKSTVKTINQPTLDGSGGMDNPHVHPNLPQYDLTAP